MPPSGEQHPHVTIDGEEQEVKKITVVQVGSDKTYIEVPSDASWQDVVEALGGSSGKSIKNRGEDVSGRDDQPRDGDQVLVAPRSVKQGS